MVVKVRTIILLIMMVIIIYVFSTIGYTLLFVETPMIIIPEHTFQIRFEDITYGFLILFLGFLMVGGALLYDFYQHIFKETVHVFSICDVCLFLLNHSRRIVVRTGSYR